MEQILISVGAAIFGFLGTVHLVYTFFTDKFEAYDSDVTKAMKNTTPILTKDTTMWNAWIGFNASHSLGAIVFGAIYLPMAVSHFHVVRESMWLLHLPVLVGVSYLALAKKYWFKIPFIGILVSTICFSCAALLANL